MSMTPPQVPWVPPYGLTPSEARVMDSLASIGNRKLVARALNIQVNTVSDHIRSALLKMGVKTYGQALLLWDRARRDAQADQLVRALKRLLDSDSDGDIAKASSDELADAATDMKTDPVVREQAAAVLQARRALAAVGV